MRACPPVKAQIPAACDVNVRKKQRPALPSGGPDVQFVQSAVVSGRLKSARHELLGQPRVYRRNRTWR